MHYLEEHPHLADVPRFIQKGWGRKRWRDYHRDCSWKKAEAWPLGVGAEQDQTIANARTMSPAKLAQLGKDG
jgi:hypothetical protein